MVLFLQSRRKRKQVTYLEDGNEADDNDVLYHQDGNNDSSEDTQSNIVHRDTSEPTSNQMHTKPGNTEGISEEFQGFELHEDQPTDSAPPEYLFTGGGFCTEEGDEQDPAGDAIGAEMEHGTNDPFGCIDGVPDVGRSTSVSATVAGTENANMDAEGESSSKRLKAGRGLSAMPTLTKRRRKS